MLVAGVAGVRMHGMVHIFPSIGQQSDCFEAASLGKSKAECITLIPICNEFRMSKGLQNEMCCACP
jgi:hypothetical protein